MYTIMVVVDVDADEFRDSSHATESAEGDQETLGLASQGHRCTVEEDDVGTIGVELGTACRCHILGTKHEDHLAYRVFFVHRGNMCHQSQVLDQTTGLTFGSI